MTPKFKGYKLFVIIIMLKKLYHMYRATWEILNTHYQSILETNKKSTLYSDVIHRKQ